MIGNTADTANFLVLVGASIGSFRQEMMIIISIMTHTDMNQVPGNVAMSKAGEM